MAVSTVVLSSDVICVDGPTVSVVSGVVAELFAEDFAADAVVFAGEDFAGEAFVDDVLVAGVCFVAGVFAAPDRDEVAFVVEELPVDFRNEEEPAVDFADPDFADPDFADAAFVDAVVSDGAFVVRAFVVLVFVVLDFRVEPADALLEVDVRRLACARRIDSAGSDDLAGAASAASCCCATSSARSPLGKKTSDGRPVSWLGISEPRPRPRPRRFSAIPDSSQ